MTILMNLQWVKSLLRKQLSKNYTLTRYFNDHPIDEGGQNNVKRDAKSFR
jgi:hypothetical protein